MYNQKKVAVLLAVYNGTQWIDEQIKSILEQNNVQVTIFVSVDKSTDGTEEYIQNLCSRYSNIIALPFGLRFGGAAKNFFHLIQNVDFSQFDFVSLADQDDVWNQNKLSNAITSLVSGYDFYSSNVLAFWPDGKEALVDKAQHQVLYDYFFEPAGPGCTYVFKVAAAIKLKEFLNANYSNSIRIDYHDWFIYAYARSNGYNWFIDANPSMRYRQHGNNQIGANVTLASAYKRLGLIRSKWYRSEVQKIISLMGGGDSDLIKSCLADSYKGNLVLLLNVNKFRRRFRDRLMLSAICLLGWF